MKPDQDTVALYQAASDWFTRRRAKEDWSDQVEAQWLAWMQADARHRNAYREIAQTWDAFDELARPSSPMTQAPASPMPPGKSARQGSRPFSLGGWLTGLARWPAVGMALTACMLAGIGGWFWHDNTAQFSQRIQTAAGARSDVLLPDGSVLAVNGNSRLEVLFYPRRRQVRLEQGEAFFSVASRQEQPFQVQAGKARIQVVGTAFNVRTGSLGVHVTVREGIVEVSRDDDARRVERLRAGDAISLDAAGQYLRTSVTPQDAGSWRNGRLVFRNLTLAEVADELQGYLGHPIELSARNIRSWRLSGFANSDNVASFLDALPQLLPVSVRHLPEGGYRISPR